MDHYSSSADKISIIAPTINIQHDKDIFSRKFYLHVIFVYINFVLLQILYQNIMTITLSSTLQATIIKSESSTFILHQ